MTPRKKKTDEPTPPNEETQSSAPSADPTTSTGEDHAQPDTEEPEAQPGAADINEKCEHGVFLEHSCADCNRMANEDAAADDTVECCSVRFTLDTVQEQPYVCTLAPGHPGPHHDEIANMTGTTAEPTLREFADAAPGADDAYKATLEIVPGTVQTQPRTVAIIEADYQHLMNLLGSVESCRSEYNSAKEDANHAKKALETAQSALERALDRIRAGQAAAQEPTLPFDAPAGIPEPSPEGLPYDGIHQSDVAQPEPTRQERVLATSAWLIERGWKHCDPEHCERYSDDDLDKLLAWSRGDTDIPDIDGLTTAE